MPSDHDIRLEQAASAFRAGQFPSIRKCAAAFGVNYSTLSRHLRGQQSRRAARAQQQLLSPEQEEHLVQWILRSEAGGNAINHAQFREAVLLVCQVANGPSKVGKDWIYRFLRRHPEVKTKIGQKLDHQRAQASTIDTIQAFFTQLQTLVSQYDIKPQNIWNMDETGIALGVCTNQTVLGTSSTNRTYVQRPENREWVSVIEAVSATGQKIRNIVIFKAQSVQITWFKADNIPDALYTTSEKGWTSNSIGLHWLTEVFLPETFNSDQYRLLVLDGHGSHITVEFMWQCYQSKVLLLYLPAHTSHILQPLDLTCFSSLKGRYRTQIANLASLDDSLPIKKARFIEYYAKARVEGLSSRNIRRGFATAGIVPFNPQKVLASHQVLQQVPKTPGVQSSRAPATANSAGLTPRNLHQMRRSIDRLQDGQSISRSVRRLLFSVGRQLDRFSTTLALQQRQISHQTTLIEEYRQRKARKKAIDPNILFKDIATIKRAQDLVNEQNQAWEQQDRQAEARRTAQAMLQSNIEQHIYQFHVNEAVVVDNRSIV